MTFPSSAARPARLMRGCAGAGCSPLAGARISIPDRVPRAAATARGALCVLSAHPRVHAQKHEREVDGCRRNRIASARK